MSTTVRFNSAATSPASPFAVPRAPGPEEWDAYLSRHAKSFSAASRLMPEPQRTQLAGVYAYCRYTDDLVDRAICGRDELVAALDHWETLSREAYDGVVTGVPLLDAVMPEMASHHVPFEYVTALLRGMRHDAVGGWFESMAQLREYCYNVASVVGLWLTEFFGVHDAWTLERAAELGIAMQLTNIVRDVGEDWRRGRLYLPRELMHAHGVTPAMIDEWSCDQANMLSSTAYSALLEEIMQYAEQSYARADEAIPNLPPFFRPAVAAASRLYRAIHDVIRENGYDNLRRRAVVSAGQKLALVRAVLTDHSSF